MLSHADYLKLLQGQLVIDRHYYHPTNWCYNPKDAMTFANYLISANYERPSDNENTDYHLVALPIREQLFDSKTNSHRALKHFNRHYGAYYVNYESDEFVEGEDSQTIRLPDEMIDYLQVWNVSQETIRYYDDHVEGDPSCFRDFTKTYHGIETRNKTTMWSSLLDSPDHLKFIQYYKEMIANDNNNLAYYMSTDYINYLNEKTNGCQKWYDQGTDYENDMINYAVYHLCMYYQEKDVWTSPLLTRSDDVTTQLMAPTIIELSKQYSSTITPSQILDYYKFKNITPPEIGDNYKKYINDDFYNYKVITENYTNYKMKPMHEGTLPGFPSGFTTGTSSSSSSSRTCLLYTSPSPRD